MIHFVDDYTDIPLLQHAVDEIVFFNHKKPVDFEYTTKFSFKYLTHGSLTYRIGNRRIEIKKGQFIIIKSNRHIEILIDNEAQGVSIFFGKDYSDSLDQLIIEQTIPLLHNDFTHTVHEVKNRFIQYRSINIPSMMEQLILTINNYSSLVTKWKSSIQYEKTSTSDDVLIKLLNARLIIEEYYQTPLDLDEIAKNIAMSKFNFIRRFKEAFGTTPQQFLIDKRIEEAKKMILHSEKTITEVSSACGFQSIHHFSKTFRKRVGITPSRCKKTMLDESI